MRETPIEAAASVFEQDRRDMVIAAEMLVRRLSMLAERVQEGTGFDLPTIVSLMERMRGSIEAYKLSRAVHRALVAAAQPSAGDQEVRG